MPNNPVQVLLNDQDFLRAPEPGRAGVEKDFFEGHDAAFRDHKQNLLAHLDAIEAEIRDSAYGPAAYLRVQMRGEALAKSYRPNRALFVEDKFPCVGADGVGTLYYRAPLIYLPSLRARMEAAEPVVVRRVSRNTGKEYLDTSRERSELGAIEWFEIAPAADKRPFSAAAALQILQDPRAVSGYMIELFETPDDKVIADDPLGRAALRSSLERSLLSLGRGSQVVLAPSIGRTPVLELQLTRADRPALIESRRGIVSGDTAVLAELDLSVDRHEQALTMLADHPLVRTIQPPVMLEVSDREYVAPSSVDFEFPAPSAEARYPVVGVVDSGIADCLSDWVVGRFDFLDKAECNPRHGTHVAGLVVAGQATNGPEVVPEPSGCQLYDAALYPSVSFQAKYPRGFVDFLEELEQAVSEASSEHRVRIFNLSINAIAEVEAHRYSIYAARLDEIADLYNVVFVNSAGNLPISAVRSPWPKSPKATVQYFANRRDPDTIFKPSESVRNISVGALNPRHDSQVEGAPTIYTRRGPGLQVGVKPDVAAIGGAGGGRAGEATGLRSIGVEGGAVDVAGTSFAAPLVARTLAGLDVMTEGGLETDALRAILIHGTAMPAALKRQGLKELGRQFAGFGQPIDAARMLETDDHQITLVFQSRLTVGEKKPAILRFPFEWPQALVDQATGACSGRARITLIYTPPLDPAFGAEFVRVNLDASLKQKQRARRADGAERYLNQIKPRYLPSTTNLGVTEKALIAQGLKWWPSKQYESVFADKGESSSWRFEVTSLVRAEATFPAEGVRFAAILTIEDPDGTKPIFQQMQQGLQASAARMVGIRTAQRLRPRGQ